MPFANLTEQQIIVGVAQRGLRPPIPSDCVEGYAKLMQDCWNDKASLRPNFEEILMRLR